MIEELGLGDRLEWKAPVTATLRDGRLHQLDSPASLLRFSPLPVADRLRMGAALADPQGHAEPAPARGQTAARWTPSLDGRGRAYDVVWEPLLRGKFGDDARREIAMPWFWARVHDRTQQLGYLRGGFQQLYERLAERSARRPAARSASATSVTSVTTPMATSSSVETDAGAERFDRVVSTLATRLTARLVPELPREWRDRARMGSSLRRALPRSSRWIGR